MEGVSRADIIFGYLEKDNPNGAGLALEIGFATALNETSGISKTIIFIEEDGFPHNRYFGMVRTCADIVESSLEAGILQLKEALLDF